MNNFSISCQESKIENNKSFYGSFCLGTFDQSLSITIANSLRRVLLSEINGLGIVSVQIQGVTHEYSNLEGIHEPVLDILLNLKELVLKKNVKNFKPQIAYLNVHGPGIVRASDILLPPSIQCADPDQYIATLAEDGVLNMKIYINYGSKWLMSSNKTLDKASTLNYPISKIKESNDSNYEKRSIIIKKLIQLGFISSNFYKEELIKKGNFLVKNSNKLEKSRLQKLNKFRQNIFRTSFPSLKGTNKPLSPEEEKGLFALHPLKGEGTNQTKRVNSFPGRGLGTKSFPERENKGKNPLKNIFYPNVPLEKQIKIDIKKNLTKFARSITNRSEKSKVNLPGFESKKGEKNRSFYMAQAEIETPKLIKNYTNSYFLNQPNVLTIDSIFNPINKVNYVIEVNDFKTALNIKEKASTVLEFYTLTKSLNLLKTDYEKNSLDSFIHNQSFPSLKETNKPKRFVPSEEPSLQPPLETTRKEKRSSFREQSPSHPLLGEGTTLLGEGTTLLGGLGTKSENEGIEEVQGIELLTDGNVGTELKNKKEDLSTLAELKEQINSLEKEVVKHNIILEIWTNGSIHPRDALYQAFKKLIKTFSSLYKVNPLITSNFNLVGTNPFSLKKEDSFPHPSSLEDKEQNEGDKNNTFIRQRYLLKQSKINIVSSQFDKNVVPLNEKYFIDTYLNPSVKNFYFNNNFVSETFNKNAVLVASLPFVPSLKGTNNPFSLVRSFPERENKQALFFRGQGTKEKKQVHSEELAKQNILKSELKFGVIENQNTEIIGNDITLRNTIKINKFYKLDISYLKFSLRTYTLLKRLNINTIENLLTFVETNLSNSTYKNLNKNEVYEIKKNLLKLGY